MKHHWLVLVLVLPVACSPPAAAPKPATSNAAALDTLLERMRQRLDLMHDVARTKWNAKRPIRDPEREKVLLEQVIKRARAYPVDQDFVRSFFVAQMEAAVLMQEADFTQWRRDGQPPFANPPTLAALRQQIDEINQVLLAVLAPAQSFLQTAEGREHLQERANEWLADYPQPVREAALRPLGERPVGP